MNEKPTECELCPSTEVSVHKFGMWMCEPCAEKEIALQKANSTPMMQDMRVNEMNLTMNQIREIDQTIQLKTDIFNADTVAIVKRKEIIDSDPSIENKQMAMATELKELYDHLASVIFDKRTELIEAQNKQRAVLEYLNKMANTLREEERAKLKLNDISYNPGSVKITKGDKKPRATKSSKEELRNLAAQYNVPMEMIQTFKVAKNLSDEYAAKFASNVMHGTNYDIVKKINQH